VFYSPTMQWLKDSFLLSSTKNYSEHIHYQDEKLRRN
jgi:hypothetical protein